MAMKINFKKRTVDGKPYQCKTKPNVTLDECLEKIEELYHKYKYSMPTEIDKKNTYFYALSADELSDEELMLGGDRTKLKRELEMYVLDMICAGVLKWDNKRMGGNWFYKGKDKDLVILRDWIEQ